MDPATIIGTVSAVLSFVSAINKIVSVARDLHDAKGTALEIEQFKELSAGLHTGLVKLEGGLLNKEQENIPISSSESSLRAVLVQCVDIENNIISLAGPPLERPQQNVPELSAVDKVKANIAYWTKVTVSSFRIVLNKSQADDLKNEFHRCVTLLNTHLMEISRTDIIAKLDTHSKRNDDNTAAIQNSIKEWADWNVLQIDLQLAANHKELLNTIEIFRKEVASSREVLETTIHGLILDGIGFPDMNSRLDQIEDQGQAEGTFEWLIDDDEIPESQQGSLTMSFRQWLSDDSQGIFYIAGKPGSGKSTLMRFLKEHAETRTQLGNWGAGETDSPSPEPVVAAMFFWNIGSNDQKSMNGLYRTLLHTILEAHQAELIPVLFPKQLVSMEERLRQNPKETRVEKIGDEEVKDAFLELIEDTTSKFNKFRFCLFIDGADEFNDPTMYQFKLAKEINRWVDINPKRIKICVSSREEEPWLAAFKNHPRLTIHLTTDLDIQTMILDAIEEHPAFQGLDEDDAYSFVELFVEIADGVFLWTKLILSDVVEMLDYGKNIDDLMLALENYPPELDKLFDKIMRDKVRNKDEALTVLKMMLELKKTKPDEPREAGSYMIDFELRHFALVKHALAGEICYRDQWPKEGDWDEDAQRISEFRRTLPFLFGGFVVPLVPESRGEIREYKLEILEFSHRSVYQYLDANLEFKTDDEAKIRLAVLQCKVAGMRVQTRCSIPEAFHAEQLISLVSWIAEAGETTQERCFEWLEDMEHNLFRISDVELIGASESDSGSGSAQGDSDPDSADADLIDLTLKARTGPHQIFIVAAGYDLVPYTEWALSRETCTSQWITTLAAEAQGATLEKVLDLYIPQTHDYEESWPSEVRCPLRLFLAERPNRQPPIIDPNALVNTYCGSFPVWQYFIIRALLQRHLLVPSCQVWDDVGTFLECGARPDVEISWSVDEERFEREQLETRDAEPDSDCAEGARFTPFCLKEMTISFSNSPPQKRRGLRTEDSSEVELEVWELLRQEIPNGSSLRDIFVLFGPKDRPDILKLLEVQAPSEEEPEVIDDERPAETELVHEQPAGLLHPTPPGDVKSRVEDHGFLLMALFGAVVSLLGYVFFIGWGRR
ncbi:hypothetical protein QBC39DRAFT_345761 [Podospora conica]|nr:hypothetical protein QBC39DRAFT_345761 [Schizothecium conicum]